MATKSASAGMSNAYYNVAVSVTRNGDLKPEIEVAINGHKRSWSIPKASNHVVYYLAVLSCIIDAVANGATSAVVNIGNQTATRQLDGSEKPKLSHTIALHEAVWIAAGALPGGLKVQ